MKFSELVNKLHTMVSPYNLYDITNHGDCDINDIGLLVKGQMTFEPNTLYFSDQSTLDFSVKLPANFFYSGSLNSPKKAELINSARIHKDDMAGLFQKAKKLIYSSTNIDDESSAIYIKIMQMFLNGENATTVLSEIGEYTGDMLAVIDSTGQLLSKSSNFHVGYSLWMKSVEQGYCDKVLMNYIEDIRKDNGYSLSPEPFVLLCNHLNMFIKCARIVYGSNLYGYIFIVSNSDVLFPIEKQAIPLISNKMREKLLRADAWTNYESTLRSNILQHMLPGRDDNMAQHMSFSTVSFPANMRVLAVKPSYFRGSEYLTAVLLPDMRKIFPDAPVAVYNNVITILLGVSEAGAIPSDFLSSFQSYMENDRLYAGISNCFSNVNEISTHLWQAAQMLIFAKKMNALNQLVFFSDYACYTLFDQIEDKKVFAQAIHPMVEKLKVYDNEKKSSLYQTLKVYTQTGFNKVRTAELMFMHRNTVNYRIQQIEEVCGIDLYGEKLLSALQLSFMIDSYLDNKPL